MKKIYQTLSLLAAFFVAICAFTACSSDDDGPEDKPKGKEISIAINYQPSEDLLLVSHITFTYSDGVNASVKETVKGKLEKTFKITRFPCTATYKIEVTPKSSFEKKESYNLTNTGSVNVTRNGSPVKTSLISGKFMGVDDIEGLIQNTQLKAFGAKDTLSFDSNSNME